MAELSGDRRLIGAWCDIDHIHSSVVVTVHGVLTRRGVRELCAEVAPRTEGADRVLINLKQCFVALSAENWLELVAERTRNGPRDVLPPVGLLVPHCHHAAAEAYAEAMSWCGRIRAVFVQWQEASSWAGVPLGAVEPPGDDGRRNMPWLSRPPAAQDH